MLLVMQYYQLIIPEEQAGSKSGEPAFAGKSFTPRTLRGETSSSTIDFPEANGAASNALIVESLGGIAEATSREENPLALQFTPTRPIARFGAPDHDTQRGTSPEEVAAIVARSLSALKVYVVESEITDAQNSIKSIVRQASF